MVTVTPDVLLEFQCCLSFSVSGFSSHFRLSVVVAISKSSSSLPWLKTPDLLLKFRRYLSQIYFRRYTGKHFRFRLTVVIEIDVLSLNSPGRFLHVYSRFKINNSTGAFYLTGCGAQNRSGLTRVKNRISVRLNKGNQ